MNKLSQIFAPIQEEGKTLYLHGQKKSLLLWASNEAAFDCEYWLNRNHVVWSTAYGALYYSPSIVAKCVSHLHEYINAKLHLS